jgi:CheY-like chemotaxis protein/anti-sigma regulatory factor (Ser/Thr protein kinase)
VVEITLVVAIFGLMLGGGVFVALRVLPLRALERATEALQEEVKQHAKARAAAEAANRGKSQFLAAASHDLRQPLHALGLFAASLSEKERDPEKRAVVDNISASVEALEALFTELLDISKLDAGVIQPNLCKGVRLSVRPTTARVYSDATLLERILRNLIANAIRYTHKGSVVVGCRSRGNGYSLEVWDSGMGIPEDKLGRIFDEFYQASNPERDRRKGLGLGLAIVKRIEQLLGYRLEVSSTVGRGSVFRLTVPRGRTERLGPEDAAWAKQTSGQLRAKCILVVDDEFAIREGMKALLSGWGCDVIAAESLSEALAGIAEHARKPQAIIADYRLREGATGVEVIQSLHDEFGRDIPAILVTGDISADSMIDVRESGYAQLHKPVPAATLRAALNAMFEKA